MTSKRSEPELTLKPPRSFEYEVGYAKPPEATRFKAGQSGNPKGRPKGARNKTASGNPLQERIKDVILQEAYRKVTISDSKGRPIKLEMARAVVRSQGLLAAKGNARAQRDYLDTLRSVHADDARLVEARMQAALEYKAEWTEELERRKREGVIAPDPVPHPDDVLVNDDGEVNVRGPKTKEEKAKWDRLKEILQEAEEEIAFAKEELVRCPELRPVLEFEITHSKKTRDLIKSVGRGYFDRLNKK